MTKTRNRRILLTLILAGIVAAGSWGVSRIVKLRPAEGETLSAEAPAEGIGRAPAVTRYLGAPEAMEIDTAEREILETYTEGEGPAPAWYRPDEPMSAEWRESYRQVVSKLDDAEPHPPVGIDAGGIDWNLCSTVWGWDGHGAEVWELDLLARVFYLEFWGTSLPCSEAGCDAILNLWDTGRYGRTLFDALSYYDPDYGYTYRVYPKVWQTDYDAEGLAWCKEFCTGRFINGPEWGAVYFQLGGYHDTEWVPPLYEMDGVYFSGKGWN